MPTFSYVAVNPKGAKITGKFEATDRSAALKSLSKQDIKPLSVKEVGAKGGSFDIKKLMGGSGVKSDDLVIFTRQLSAMVSAGVPLLRAISSLAEKSDRKNFQTVLFAVRKDIEGGAPLADSLAKYPRVFNDVYVNMVRAGEAAGILDDILKRLATQQEKNATMRKKVKSAMTYPMVLVFITILAFFGLMIFVIPQIGKILTDLGGPDAQLPLLTQVMLGISHVLINYAYIVFPLIAGAVFLLVRWLRTRPGKFVLHRFVLKVPGLKEIVRKVAVARFARTFSALIGAGVPVLEALDVTAKAVGNLVFEQALLDASEAVENGDTLSSIIEKNDIFPAIVPQMLSVGEETGQTDKVLVKVADFYEEEVDVAIEGLSSIIEPVMIVFMGSMVGVIAASVMMPIASLSQNIKG